MSTSTTTGVDARHRIDLWDVDDQPMSWRASSADESKPDPGGELVAQANPYRR